MDGWRNASEDQDFKEVIGVGPLVPRNNYSYNNNIFVLACYDLQ